MPIDPTRRLAVKCKSCLRENFLAHYHFTPDTQPYQVEDCLPEIDADGVYLHGMPPVYCSYTAEEAADHPISNPCLELLRCHDRVAEGHRMPERFSFGPEILEESVCARRWK